MDNEFAREIIKTICQAVYDIYSMIGSGYINAKKMDIIATRRYDDLLNFCDQQCKTVHTLGVEGERDKIYVSELQKMANVRACDVQVSLDPIDGTLACSKGLCRSVSVIALDSVSTKKYNKIIDELSCFTFASNCNAEFLDGFAYIGRNRNELTSLLKGKCISTLNRRESEELWDYFLPFDKECQYGEKRLYLPNILKENLFMAGDTSIPLFLESDYYIGRSGATESLIEARLWRFWKGLLISGTKLKQCSGNVIEFLKSRIDAAYNPQCYNVSDFFTEVETRKMMELGWDKKKMLQLLSPECFAPKYDFICIASITGTKDWNLKKHSTLNLEKATYDIHNNTLKVQCWMQYNGKSAIVDVYYNTTNGGFTWKKMNI